MILDYREDKKFSAADILDGICTSGTGIISDGRTHGTDVGKTIPRHKRVAGYDYCISETHSTGVTKTCALFPNCP